MKFFSSENPVFRVISTIGMIWWLDILWVITSVPVITAGASTTALIYASIKLRKDEGTPTANFFHSFKENFRQATLIWLVYLVSGAMIAAALVYWNQTDHTRIQLGWGVVMVIGIFWLISFLWVFAIQSRFVNPVKKTIAFSLVLPYRNIRQTAAMLVIVLALIYLNLTTIVLVNYATVFFGIGLVAFVNGIFIDDAFEKYMPENSSNSEESQEV